MGVVAPGEKKKENLPPKYVAVRTANLILQEHRTTASSDWYVKRLKQSRNRPGVAQRVPGGLGSQIFMTFGR